MFTLFSKSKLVFLGYIYDIYPISTHIEGKELSSIQSTITEKEALIMSSIRKWKEYIIKKAIHTTGDFDYLYAL